jgi:inner membrane protein
MDSITHLYYGGVIAAAIAPARHRRAALLAGAALNTLPDLDIVPLAFFHNPLVGLTWHRSATHSWLVLPFVAWVLWAFFRSRGGRVAEEPVRWWWAIFACLMAHPLLDAFTVFGTQLLWPLPMRPVMWASLFIVDPLFTLPWFVAWLVAWFGGERIAGHALALGLAAGIGYVGWSLMAKTLVDRAARPALAARGLAGAPWFSVPAPMTTLRWRVVAMAPGGYVEGDRRIGDPAPMAFRFHPSATAALAAAAGVPAVQRLAWFNHGFQKAEVGADGTLVLRDLRMGSEPSYSFAYAVAQRGRDGWQAIAPYDVTRRHTRAALAVLARRLLHGDGVKLKIGKEAAAQRAAEASQAATGRSGETPAASAPK